MIANTDTPTSCWKLLIQPTVMTVLTSLQKELLSSTTVVSHGVPGLSVPELKTVQTDDLATPNFFVRFVMIFTLRTAHFASLYCNYTSPRGTPDLPTVPLFLE